MDNGRGLIEVDHAANFLGTDQLSAAAAKHHGGGIGVAGVDVRHGGHIANAEAFDTSNPHPGIECGHTVTVGSHPGGAGGVVIGLDHALQ